MTAVLPISAEPAAVPQEEAKRGRWRRMPAKAKAGAVLLGLFVLAAIIGPMVTPYDPSYQNPLPSLSLHAPYSAHLLGTTQSGQDVLSQLLVGIRLTLELAILVGVVATVLSVIVGVSAAFLGGAWDELPSLLTNVFLVIPALPLPQLADRRDRGGPAPVSAHPDQAPLPVAASSPAPGSAAPGQDPVLAIRNLSVVYRTPGGDVRAVDQVNLDLAAGEVIGLAGESGSGKSTLVYGGARDPRPPRASRT